MFTGIIEETGTILRVKTGAKSSVLSVGASRVLEGTRVGDSIAVNGVCLTVTALASGGFEADVMAETMRRTNLGSMRPGSRVNLERALSLSSRLGGHIVSGHVDGTGVIGRMTREDNAVWVTVEAEARILRYIVEKGSVAIDGISLTVAGVTDRDFSVSIIPHTGEETTLLRKRAGDTVNLECDIIGKYVEKLLGGAAVPREAEPAKSRVDASFLMEHGFL